MNEFPISDSKYSRLDISEATPIDCESRLKELSNWTRNYQSSTQIKMMNKEIHLSQNSNQNILDTVNRYVYPLKLPINMNMPVVIIPSSANNFQMTSTITEKNIVPNFNQTISQASYPNFINQVYMPPIHNFNRPVFQPLLNYNTGSLPIQNAFVQSNPIVILTNNNHSRGAFNLSNYSSDFIGNGGFPLHSTMLNNLQLITQNLPDEFKNEPYKQIHYTNNHHHSNRNGGSFLSKINSSPIIIHKPNDMLHYPI